MTVLAESAPAGIVRYSVLVATESADIAGAQRLRHRVFAEELGAKLNSNVPGHDIDQFDAYCDHLIVRDEASKDVVATYRLLPPGRTDRLYADGEFDLSALAPLRDALVETGRSCVHPQHRTGAVINLLWAGIARYLHLSGRRWVGGCASVPLDDASAVWHRVRRNHLAPPRLRVVPRHPWPVDAVTDESSAPKLPALLRGYLRLGAWVCGPPAHDPDFGVADLFVLLSFDRTDPRYLRRFLERS